MRFILSLLKSLTSHRPHNDSVRADSWHQTISGYAVMYKVH